MTKTTFYVEANTQEIYADPDEYDKQGDYLIRLLRNTLGDADKALALTKNAKLTAFDTECEVLCDENEYLVARCVVECETSTGKASIDKPKLTQILKSSLLWPNMKVHKRMIENTEKPTPPPPSNKKELPDWADPGALFMATQ